MCDTKKIKIPYENNFQRRNNFPTENIKHLREFLNLYKEIIFFVGEMYSLGIFDL